MTSVIFCVIEINKHSLRLLLIKVEMMSTISYLIALE